MKMITNKGKDVITKYLLGQTATYASYISFGCGATPGDAANGNETAMEFEMLRVPISSRSLVKLGQNKIISLAGELPLSEHYDITEVAVWSDASNGLSASNSDSRVLFAFNNTENWQQYVLNGNIYQNEIIEYISNPLGPEDGSITIDKEIFSCSANNSTLQNGERLEEGQGVRFLDNTVMLRGDCWIDEDSPSNGIRLQVPVLDLSEASPSDEIRIALSLYPTEIPDDTASVPEAINVRLRMRFLTEQTQNNNGSVEQIAATIDTVIYPEPGQYYHIVKVPMKDLQITNNFIWKDVSAVDLTVGITPRDNNTDVKEKWYVGIDAVRFENLTTPNPLYAMVGYSVAKEHIKKFANTNAYVEFRYGVDTLFQGDTDGN